MTQESGHFSSTPEIAPVVLVVEDHESYREVVCRALQSYINGVCVLGCGSVAAAASMLGQHRVNVLVVDMTLPDGTALDLLREAQQHVAQGTMVILFSNYSSAEMQPLRERTDIHAVLTKDQGLRDLAKAVREALAAGKDTTAGGLPMAAPAV